AKGPRRERQAARGPVPPQGRAPAPGRGGKPCEVKEGPPQQGQSISLRRECESFLLQLRQDKSVNRRTHPVGVSHSRNRRTLWLLKGPERASRLRACRLVFLAGNSRDRQSRGE